MIRGKGLMSEQGLKKRNRALRVCFCFSFESELVSIWLCVSTTRLGKAWFLVGGTLSMAIGLRQIAGKQENVFFEIAMFSFSNYINPVSGKWTDVSLTAKPTACSRHAAQM